MLTPLRQLSNQLPLLRGAHGHPCADLGGGAQTALAVAAYVQRTDFDAGRWGPFHGGMMSYHWTNHLRPEPVTPDGASQSVAALNYEGVWPILQTSLGTA